MLHVSVRKSSKMEETGSPVSCFECKMGFTKFYYQTTISLTVSCWIWWTSKRNPLTHQRFYNSGSRQTYLVTKRLWNLCRTWHYLSKIPKGNLTTDFSKISTYIHWKVAGIPFLITERNLITAKWSAHYFSSHVNMSYLFSVGVIIILAPWRLYGWRLRRWWWW
jgi:hypothetical protein